MEIRNLTLCEKTIFSNQYKGGSGKIFEQNLILGKLFQSSEIFDQKKPYILEKNFVFLKKKLFFLKPNSKRYQLTT